MSKDTRIRILCVDDHALMREAIASLITFQPDMLLVAEASTGEEAIRKYKEHHPDVTLMDLRLPDMDGIDAMIAIRAEAPDAAIAMLTTFEGEAERARQAGARAYILKNTPPKELADAIRRVHAHKQFS